MKVFVSYTFRDGQINPKILRSLRQSLDDQCDTFIDALWHPYGGHQRTLFSALRNSDALYLVMSPLIYTSPWVALELAIARQQGIPITRMRLSTTTAPNMTLADPCLKASWVSANSRQSCDAQTINYSPIRDSHFTPESPHSVYTLDRPQPRNILYFYPKRTALV